MSFLQIPTVHPQRSRFSRVVAVLITGTGLFCDLAAGDVTTFEFTGNVQTYVVPAGVNAVRIDASGAQGGGSSGDTAGGLGARMIGTYSVTPGHVLSVVVGQQGLLQVGGNAQNSSGGGGGTFVYDNEGPTLLVAAGGGGGKCNFTGSSPLHDGAAGQVTTNGGPSSDGNPGGTAGNGGPAGLWSDSPCSGGGAGWLSAGGGPFGGLSYGSWAGGPGFGGGGGGGAGGVGGFGGGGGGGNHYGGGGGGGGYSGGGGGTDPTHGGGGGSYSIGTGQNNTAGYKTGNGLVAITTLSGSPEISVFKGSVSGDELGDNGIAQNLGSVNVGNSSLAQTITIKNTGTLNLAGIAVTSSNATEFSVDTTGISSTLAPGETTTFTVTFFPSSKSARSGVISIASNDGDENPFRINVSGTGVNPTAFQQGSTSTFNRLNGLFELTVNVTNTTSLSINGFRLHVNFAPYLANYPSLRLYNASSAVGSSDVYVDYPYPVAGSGIVPVKLTFYTSSRTFPSPFSPVLTVETLATSAVSDTNGSGVQPRLAILPDHDVMLEFDSVPGRWYRVRYSHDLAHWFDCPVPIQAANNRMQWIDSGAPFTISPPSSVPSRYYRVNEINVVPAP